MLIAYATCSSRRPRRIAGPGEAYYDIKVHCFVSCVCDGPKKRGLDQRPFYFGIWDTEFDVTDRYQLRYHSETISHEFFRSWFERLYGVRVVQWYDPTLSKSENLAVMTELVRQRSDTGSVMVMLDMFHMPERENKFNQNPFPHYLMLQETEDQSSWFVNDTDYRWEGVMERQKVIHAIMQPTVAGGYMFDTVEARPPDVEDIKAYFEACFVHDRNPVADALRSIIDAHTDGVNALTLADLAIAVRELPILTIRKYAYEHGFAFFWRALKLPAAEFEAWCEEIEALVQSLKNLHYACMKLAQTQDTTHLKTVCERLADADCIETKIKNELGRVFALWRERFCMSENTSLRRMAG